MVIDTTSNNSVIDIHSNHSGTHSNIMIYIKEIRKYKKEKKRKKKTFETEYITL